MIVLTLWISALLIIPLAAAVDWFDHRFAGKTDIFLSQGDEPAPRKETPVRRQRRGRRPSARQRGSIRLASGPRHARSGR